MDVSDAVTQGVAADRAAQAVREYAEKAPEKTGAGR